MMYKNKEKESKTITIGIVIIFISWIIAQAFFYPPAEQGHLGRPVAIICIVLFLLGVILLIVRQLIGSKSRQKKTLNELVICI